MHTYLDFEKPIQDLEENIASSSRAGDYHAVETLKEKLQEKIEKVYTTLDDYNKLQLARHPDRPYSLDYVKLIMSDYHEIHGDRHFEDDLAIVAFIGYIGETKAIVVGQEKGRGTKSKIKRNFGMPSPSGYRKALRIAKMAEKFNLPILMLIDTPGAYPGLGAEERNQSEAIAKNLFEFSSLKTTIISVVIGEGGSGGALAIGVGDRLAMMRYSVLSIISPEGCSAILWKDNSKVQVASQALQITAEHLKELGLIDDIIDEPIDGAHRNKEVSAQCIKEYFLQNVKELENITPQEREDLRFKKLFAYGSFEQSVQE